MSWRSCAVKFSTIEPVPAYCPANPGNEYLIYLPAGGTVTVDLSAVNGT